MTRLTSNDISDISETITHHEQQLIAATNCGLLGIGCHAYGLDEIMVRQRISQLSSYVIPVTSGKGVISGFSDSVKTVLNYLGMKAQVTERSDIGGLNEAFAKRADIVLMSDDDHFVAFNLQTRTTVHNSEATGRGFAAALDLTARADGDNSNKNAFIIGCGPVGSAGACALLDYGFALTLYDTELQAAENLKSILAEFPSLIRVTITNNLNEAITCNQYILEATPAPGTIAASCIRATHAVAAPGVPVGITSAGLDLLNERAIHDKLELGIAAMIAGLLA